MTPVYTSVLQYWCIYRPSATLSFTYFTSRYEGPSDNVPKDTVLEYNYVP